MSLIVTDTSMENARQARSQVEVQAELVPSFSEYRRLNDPTMTPDRGFVKQLKKLDSEFEVVWDWGSAKWEIWKFPKALGLEPYHVTTVQTKNKSYRELGADVLLKLQWGDPSRFSLNELVAYFDEMDNQVRRRKAKDFKDKIGDITRETKSFVNVLRGRPIKEMRVPNSLAIRRMVCDA